MGRFPPIKMGPMGDGEDRDSERNSERDSERHLCSTLSGGKPESLDGSVTIMAGPESRRQIAQRMALTRLQTARASIFGMRRVALESKKISCLRVARALAAFVWLGMLGPSRRI